ncbi:MAG: hypothetical protein PHD46_05140 [Eubacteriales bacterium]|nr:hypothetical protein [Eubacteriales bacterium]MDD4422402.1 hypothetical protein [Eubacteriales bacterium]
MSNFLKKYNQTKGVISAVLYAALLGAFLQIFEKSRYTDSTLNGFAFAGIIVTGFLFIRAIIRLLKKKYKKFFKKLSQKTKKLKAFFKQFGKRFTNRFGIKKLRYLLLGNDKIEFMLGEIRRNRKREKEKQKRLKLPKWEELKNNRARVRYIYTVFLLRLCKGNYRIDPAKTPAEIAKVHAQNDMQRRLFAYYSKVRYEDESLPVKNEVVTELLSNVKISR